MHMQGQCVVCVSIVCVCVCVGATVCVWCASVAIAPLAMTAHLHSSTPRPCSVQKSVASAESKGRRRGQTGRKSTRDGEGAVVWP